jgi:predicted NUDIX family phosphoesterase
MASEFLSVARQVLQKTGRPMRPKEIVSEAIRLRLFSDRRAGRTPHQTMKSKLSVHVRRHGEASDFVRTAPGQFFLRQLLRSDHAEYSARPIAKPHSTESVLVFDSDWFPQVSRFQGVKQSWTRLCNRLFRSTVCEYLPRLEAERSNTYKQVVTYIMVTRGSSVLAYRRGHYNRVEDFLRGSDCIGFGGHVTEGDRTLFTQSGMGVFEASIRELNEELNLPSLDKKRLQNGEGLSIVGVLNDDSSEVGQRHFAVVLRYEVSNAPQWQHPKRSEKSITQLRWLTPNHSPLAIWDFEYWSQLCLRSYFPELVRAAPAFRIRRKRVFDEPHILCLLGEVGSGKSETTNVLCHEFGYSEINTGRLLAHLLKIPPVPQTPREVFQRRAWSFISSSEGPIALARSIAAHVSRLDTPRILVDGLRQRATFDALRPLVNDRNIARLFVHTTPDLAFAFYRSRERQDTSFPEFLKLRSAPVEGEVPEMIGVADAVLYNWAGRGEYQRMIRAFMRALKA